jgi:WD40 repeat protein
VRVVPSLSHFDVGVPTQLVHDRDAAYIATLEGVVLRHDRGDGAVAWNTRLDTSGVWGLALSPTGRLLAVGGERGGVALLDAATGRPVTTLARQDRATSLGIDADNVLTVVGDQVRRTQLSDPGAGHVWPWGRGITDLELSPDGARLAVAASGGWITVSWPDGAELSRVELPCVTKDVDWTPSGRLVAVLPTADCAPEQRGGVWVQPAAGGPPRAVSPSPSGRRIATLGEDGAAVISYNARGPAGVPLDGGVAPTVMQPTDGPDRIENTPDSSVAAWTSPSGLWAVEQGDPYPRHVQPAAPSGPLALTVDGGAVVVASAAGVQRLRLSDGETVWTTAEIDVFPRDVAISPDSRWAAVGARDGTTRV